MQVEVDVKCMETNFGRCSLSGFGVMAPFCLPSKQPNFSFGPWTIVHGHQKNLSDLNQPKEFMQVEVDITCMHTNFGGRDLSGFGDIATFKNGQFSLSYHGHQKI